MAEGAFPRSGRAGDQHLFPFVNGQIDVFQRRMFLAFVFKAEVLKFDDFFFSFLTPASDVLRRGFPSGKPRHFMKTIFPLLIVQASSGVNRQ